VKGRRPLVGDGWSGLRWWRAVDNRHGGEGRGGEGRAGQELCAVAGDWNWLCPLLLPTST
jgi:hypothetical protein